MNKKIGIRVKTARQNKGLTQEELAEQTNLSVSFISRLETGKVLPSLERLSFIADALDVGLEDLLCDSFKNRSQSMSPTTREIVLLLESSPESYRQYILRMTQYLIRMIPKE